MIPEIRSKEVADGSGRGNRGAEQILPGKAAPEKMEDSRWQAILRIAHYVETDTQECFAFAMRWGCYQDADLRSAIATCLLECLLKKRFDELIAQVESLAQQNPLFADTVCRCWVFPPWEKFERSLSGS